MTNQDLLIQTITQAKCTSAYLADKYIKQEKTGDSIDCCVKKLTLINRWIEILETYNCQMYETTTEGKFQCLTEEEAMLLVGKVKLFISA
jgi:hypothetical protein